jgi:hypothetical protein
VPPNYQLFQCPPPKLQKKCQCPPKANKKIKITIKKVTIRQIYRNKIKKIEERERERTENPIGGPN